MFAKNLKYLRLKNNMEQTELAQKLDRGATSVSNWENGNSVPKAGIISDIAKLFNVTMNDLMNSDLQNVSVSKNVIELNKIPVISKISAGKPIEAEENIENYISIPNAKPNTFGLIVSGDSMNKEFKEDDIVIVEKESPVENGQIGVVMINGYDATVKRIKYDDDKIILIPESYNNEHLPQIYNVNDEITIVGRVVGVYKIY